VACLAVILAHILVHFTPHVLTRTHLDFVLPHAVTFFFVLSAFLLYLPYVKNLDRGRAMPSARTYLRRRVLRIFPAYLVVFVLANFVLRAVYIENPFTVGWASGDRGTGMMTNPFQLLTNFTLTQTLFPATLQTGINASWTLTAEWTFYLLLPVVGLALFVRAKNRNRPLTSAAVPAVVLFTVGITTQIVVKALQHKYYADAIVEGGWGSNWVAVLARSFLSYADTFAIGMLAAVLYVALAGGRLSRVSTIRLQWILASVVLLGVVATGLATALMPHYLRIPAGVAAGAFILLIVAPETRNEHSAIAPITDWLPMRWFGIRALSAYLWHFPVMIVIGRLAIPIPDTPTGTMTTFAVVVAITTVIAWVTYRFVEEPGMKFGR
jgi:peptidoglycan/LPS O-acetylase OafA/YrhL